MSILIGSSNKTCLNFKTIPPIIDIIMIFSNYYGYGISEDKKKLGA